MDILDKILSVQQEKSGKQMYQSCTINISRAAAMLALPKYIAYAKACNPVVMTFFFWRPTINLGNYFHTYRLFFGTAYQYLVKRSTPLAR